jgi:hypothetical protein
MKSNYIIILLCHFLFSQSSGFSFISVDLSAETASLGGTVLSNFGSPSKIIHAPANIWTKNQLSFEATHLQDPFGAEYEMLFITLNLKPFFSKTILGGGIVFNKISDIDLYDQDSNYIISSDNNNRTVSIGLSSRISNIFLGFSLNYIESDFSNILNDNKNNFTVNQLLSKFNFTLKKIKIPFINNVKGSFSSTLPIIIANDETFLPADSSSLNINTLGGSLTWTPNRAFWNPHNSLKISNYLDILITEYNRNYLRGGIGISYAIDDFRFALNLGIRDIDMFNNISINDSYKFNVKYYTGIKIEIDNHSLTIARQTSFLTNNLINSIYSTYSYKFNF